jgi:tetratricopeptide (TPR) repeat protein
MSERYEAASFEEIELPALPERPRWATVRSYFGISAFGVNAWAANEAGQEVIEEHDELGTSAGKHEEMYVVLSGHATFTVDGETLDAPAGTFVFVRDPAVKRKAVANEADTKILAVGARPGEAFTPSPWELSAPSFRYFATGEYDKAAEVLEQAHAEHPDNGGVLFNLACAESRLGRKDDAIEHLRAAIAAEERFREVARDDSDFDPIRADPAFRELVGS